MPMIHRICIATLGGLGFAIVAGMFGTIFLDIFFQIGSFYGDTPLPLGVARGFGIMMFATGWYATYIATWKMKGW